MGISWKRQELDLEIMKLLYEHKAVRGKTIVMRFAQYDQQKIYDRLRELHRMRFIDRVGYSGITQDDILTKRKKKAKRLGKLYYLTRIGVEQVKIHVYNTELSGTEKTQRPEEKDLENYWKASVLMSEINLEFVPSRIHKREKDYPMNLMIDLGYRDWNITFVRNNQESHRINLLQLARILELRGSTKTLLLCGTRTQYMTLVKYLMANHAKDTYVLMMDDYENIRRLLNETFMDDAVQTLGAEYGLEVEKLDTPIDGYNYRTGNYYFNIYPLLGFPSETMRKLQKPVTMPGFIMVADPKQHKLLLKHYPDLFNKYRIVIAEERIHHPIKEEEIETTEEHEMYKDWAAEIDFDSL
jgi:hypothetical protein